MDKAEEIVKLLTRERNKAQKAMRNDTEYTTQEGAGVNAYEAWATLAGVLKEARKIAERPE